MTDLAKSISKVGEAMCAVISADVTRQAAEAKALREK